MNKSLLSIAVLVFSVQLDAMFLARNAKKSARQCMRKRITYTTPQRTHYSVYKEPKECELHENDVSFGIEELLSSLEVSPIKLADSVKIIKTNMPPISSEEGSDISHCVTNSLIHQIVEKAVQYKDRDAEYAHIINTLGEHGWYVHYDCCTVTALHKAVEHNLFAVAKALTQHSGDNLIKNDTLCRLPHHYIQSLPMAEHVMFNYGVGGYLDARDYEGNTPLHLVSADAIHFMVRSGADPRIENKLPFFKHTHQTFLRKAVADGDILKCKVVLDPKKATSFVTAAEYYLIKEFIAMRLYETAGELDRFKNKQYRQIACMLEESQKG